MFTPTNDNNRMLIYKKSRQRHLSEINFNSLENKLTNYGLFHKKLSAHKKSTVLHSPFHNSLLSSLNLHTEENMNRTQKENIFNKDFIIKKRNDKVICKKRFNMLSETEEELLTTAIQKRKEVFPKILNISTKYSSRVKLKQKSSLKTIISNKTYYKKKNQIKNNKTKSPLDNILVVQKVDYIKNRINHRKNYSLNNFTLNNSKPFNKYYTNIIKDDLDYMAI